MPSLRHLAQKILRPLRPRNGGQTPGQAQVKIGDRSYLLHSDDDYLVHLQNDFEPQMVKLFQTVAAEAEIILDIGANIGCTTLLFSQFSAHVHAFEPSPTTFAFLQKNVAQAGSPPNVYLHNIGLGATAGEYPLTFSPSNRAGGFVSDQTEAGGGHVVEKIVVETLDEWRQSHVPRRIPFIKMDVEGFEGQVMRGGLATIQADRPLVVLELNHWCLNAFQRTSIPDFFDFLGGIFPILLAVDGENYLDVHQPEDRYYVMYHHILHQRFPNLVAGFTEGQLGAFRQRYRHSFIE